MDPRILPPAESPGSAAAREFQRQESPLGPEHALNQRIFGLPGVPAPEEITKLRVTIHRARNLFFEFGMHCAPQITVALGDTIRRSPLGLAFGQDPVFDWVTDVRYTGQETHIVFQVMQHARSLGAGILPLLPILRAGVVHKAVPLLVNGQISDLEGPEAWARARLLYVTVECELRQQLEGSEEQAALAARLDQARRRCRQVRITVRSVDIQMSASEVQPANVLPYVHVSLGGHHADTTPVAFKVLPRGTGPMEADEFVFLRHEGTEYGALLRGMADNYETAPVAAPKGSLALQAYRKRFLDGNLQIEYRDVHRTFWYIGQDSVILEVRNDHVLWPDEVLVGATVDMDYLFRRAYAGQGDLLEYVTTGPLREPLMAIELPLREGVDETTTLGQVEFEVEFFQDPLGCPSALEQLWRRLGVLRLHAIEEHLGALQAVNAALSTRELTAMLQGHPLDLRLALATVVTAAAVCSVRNCIFHEEDGSLLQSRIAAAVVGLGEVLHLSGQDLEPLEAAARSARMPFALTHCAGLYNEKCNGRVDPMVPIIGVVVELVRTKGGYGAQLRCALREALHSVGGTRGYSGRQAFGIVERYVFQSFADSVEIRELKRLSRDCPGSEELGGLARDLTHEEQVVTQTELQEGTRKGRQSAAEFFPNIDPNLLVKSSDHPGEQLRLNNKSKAKLVASSAGMGTIAGVAGGLGIATTAELIHDIDDHYFCNPVHSTGTGFNKFMCHLMKDTSIDEFLANFLATRKGFVLFFWIYMILYGWGTWVRLRKRLTDSLEAAFDIMSPPRSPHLVVCVSGFLDTASDVYLPWQVDMTRPWTDGQIVAVRFETDALIQLGMLYKAFMQKVATQTARMVSVAMSLTNPASLVQQLLGAAVAEFDDMFWVTYKRAIQAGVRLAQQLLSTALAEAQAQAEDGEDFDEDKPTMVSTQVVRPARPVSLVGYSMGCVVIHSALREIKRVSLSTDSRAPVASNLLCDVVLVGAPVSDSDNDWLSLRQLACGRFINGYLRGDQELISRQLRLGYYLLAGTTALADVPGIESIPLDDLCHMHAHYARQMPIILMRLLHQHE